MNTVLKASLYTFFENKGVEVDSLTFSALDGGWNNRSFRLDVNGCSYFLKIYYQGREPELRMKREYDFLKFAKQAGLQQTPEALGQWREHGAALFSWVQGKRYSKVTPCDVEKAVRFIVGLNQHKTMPVSSLPKASEYCQKINDHLQYLEKRIERLEKASSLDVISMYQKRIAPLFSVVKQKLHQYNSRYPSLFQTLSGTDYCVSPSDFGFHNALEMNESPIFIDFEYAGVDDPAQLICDFFCQFEVKAPFSEFEKFSRTIASLYKDSDWHVSRMLLLMPVHRLKWLCIALNHFIQDHVHQRIFSQKNTPELRALQLTKAEKILEQLEMEMDKWLILTF